MARPNRGRKRIEIEKMQNASNLLVTFSKRRAGVFKKAHELSVLCGAELAVIVPSPGNRFHSFGHPSVERIIGRYLGGNPRATGGNSLVAEAQRLSTMQKLNQELSQLENKLEAERQKRHTLEQLRKSKERAHWWEAPIAVLNLEQLEELKSALENLKWSVDNEKHKLQAAHSSASFQAGPSGTGVSFPVAGGSDSILALQPDPSGFGHEASATYGGFPFLIAGGSSGPTHWSSAANSGVPFGSARGSDSFPVFQTGPSEPTHRASATYNGFPFSVAGTSDYIPSGSIYRASVAHGNFATRSDSVPVVYHEQGAPASTSSYVPQDYSHQFR